MNRLLSDKDRLKTLFELRRSFMNELEHVKPGTYPTWPIDITQKKSQQRKGNAGNVWGVLGFCRYMCANM